MILNAAVRVMQLSASMEEDSHSQSASLKEFYIPSYVLLPDSESETVPDVPQCPVLVFINSKSGGQLGGDLLVTCRSLLNKNQVPLVSLNLIYDDVIAPDFDALKLWSIKFSVSVIFRCLM